VILIPGIKTLAVTGCARDDDPWLSRGSLEAPAEATDRGSGLGVVLQHSVSNDWGVHSLEWWLAVDGGNWGSSLNSSLVSLEASVAAGDYCHLPGSAQDILAVYQ